MKKNASIITIVILISIVGLAMFMQKPKSNVDVTTTTTTTTTTTPTETQPEMIPPSATPPVATTPETVQPATYDGKVITLDNTNQTFSMKVDETFLLKLGEFYDWQPLIDNQDILSREIEEADFKDAQGIYKAHKEGTAILTATGDPLCRQSTPPCGAPSILFQVTLNVTAK